MRTIIFVVLIIASASYLAVGEKSPLTVSDDGTTVSVDVQKVKADVTEKLNEQFAAQLSSFKQEMTQNQQRQIEALQQSVVNLAQKSAKLEQMLAKQQYAPAAQNVETSQASQLVSHTDSGPDVGAIQRPVDFDALGYTDGEVGGDFVSESEPVQTIAQVIGAVESNDDMAMMDKQQRRKRLQQLSERMTLKSLGVEK